MWPWGSSSVDAANPPTASVIGCWRCPTDACVVSVLCRYFLMMIWSYELFWSVKNVSDCVWQGEWVWVWMCVNTFKCFSLSCCNFVVTYLNAVTWHALLSIKSCNSNVCRSLFRVKQSSDRLWRVHMKEWLEAPFQIQIVKESCRLVRPFTLMFKS